MEKEAPVSPKLGRQTPKIGLSSSKKAKRRAEELPPVVRVCLAALDSIDERTIESATREYRRMLAAGQLSGSSVFSDAEALHTSISKHRVQPRKTEEPPTSTSLSHESFEADCFRLRDACREPGVMKWNAVSSTAIRLLRNVGGSTEACSLAHLGGASRGPPLPNDALRALAPYSRKGSDKRTNTDHILEFQFVAELLGAIAKSEMRRRGIEVPHSKQLDPKKVFLLFPWASHMVCSLSREENLTLISTKLNQAKRGAWLSFSRRMFDPESAGYSLKTAVNGSSSKEIEQLRRFVHDTEPRLETALLEMIAAAANFAASWHSATREDRVSFAHAMVATWEASKRLLGETARTICTDARK
jgi:hypothetical protein